MTHRRLLLTASALVLAQGAFSSGVLAQGRAGIVAETVAPAKDRFSTDGLLSPGLTLSAPTSPAYMLGTGAIVDAETTLIDPVTTGQIPNPDAEQAADAVKTAPVASQPLPESLDETVEEDEPAAAASTPEEDAAGLEEREAPEAPKAAGESGHAAEAAFATTRAPMPFDIIRTVQFLQDQVARGNGRAIRVQAALLRRFGPVFLRADPAVWKDERNLRAALLFVLSGGPPNVLEQLLASGVVPDIYKPLFEGAIAYVSNDLAGAERLFSTVDLGGMEPGLEAHLSLVLGQLKQINRPRDAIPYLDRARLLAPGGLIEEAALRLEVLVVDGLGDHETADRLARHYFDRYSRSSYSANFEARFASVYASRGKTDAAKAMATMLDVTDRLADANRRTIFLSVARRTLVDGNLTFAALAAKAALETSGASDAERQRASLYRLAATIGTISEAEATASLAAINRDELHPEDIELLDAAYSVLAGIDRTPQLSDAGSGHEVAESSPVFDRAQQVLNEVAGDLGKGQP